MSKIEKDLGLEDMLGMLDADRISVSKQPVPEKIVDKKKEMVLSKKIAPNGNADTNSANTNSQKEATSLHTVKTHIINTVDAEEHNSHPKTQAQPDKDQVATPKKKKVVVALSKKKQTSKNCIFTLLNNFSKVFTRGECFTSVRILKEKIKYLKLLFPGKSNIEIIDTLITDCLTANRAKLKEKSKAFYDAKL